MEKHWECVQQTSVHSTPSWPFMSFYLLTYLEYEQNIQRNIISILWLANGHARGEILQPNVSVSHRRGRSLRCPTSGGSVQSQRGHDAKSSPGSKQKYARHLRYSLSLIFCIKNGQSAIQYPHLPIHSSPALPHAKVACMSIPLALISLTIL